MINERNVCENFLRLSGEVLEELKFSYSCYKEYFYTTKIGIKRDSGVYDNIPVVISKSLIGTKEIKVGDCIEIVGEYHSYNTEDKKLKLFAFANELNILDETKYENEITLTGYICKPPKYRKTPNGKEITDIFLGVNRKLQRRSDYIPVIFWGLNAEYIMNFQVGEVIKLTGRVQSRVYLKKLGDGTYEKRVAYEVSGFKFYEVRYDTEHN